MLSAAERVDAQLQEHMAANATEGPWPTQERIFVLLPNGAIGRDAIRIGKHSADRARVEWYVLALTRLRAEESQGAGSRAEGSAALRLGAVAIGGDRGAELSRLNFSCTNQCFILTI